MTARDITKYSAHVVLPDGSAARVRAARTSDAEALAQALDWLSPAGVNHHFLHLADPVASAELKGLCHLMADRHFLLLATIRLGRKDKIVGLARYTRTETQSDSAEAVVLVSRDQQGRGLGTALIEHLAEIARRSGIVEFRTDVLGRDNQMLKVLSHLGCDVVAVGDGGVVRVKLLTQEREEASRVRDEREWKITVERIRELLEPSSVALVGASRNPGSVGDQLLSNLRNAGFSGPIYPVNPAATEIQGLRCYSSVTDIGQPIDLAIVAVPSKLVIPVVEQCVGLGVRSVVVISAGFGEVSAAGRELEAQLLELVRGANMRMVGPNCLGIMNTKGSVGLNATFSPIAGRPGSVAMLTQSGGLGIALLDYAEKLGIGLSSFVAVGNKADLSGNDFVRYWADDPATKVIALYLESFGNPRKFQRIAPQVAHRKPIVAVKSGRSTAGTRAAASHSAALASSDTAVQALLEEAGVIRANTLEELFDVVSLLNSQPLTPGKRVGVVTNAGGPAILLADALENYGLSLPKFGEETLSELASFLPVEAGLMNPVDMISSATPERFARSLEIVGHDESIDAVIAVYVPPFFAQMEAMCAGIAEGAGRVPGTKPVLVVFLSAKAVPFTLMRGPRGVLPCYTFPENAARALASTVRYSLWKKRPRGTEFEPTDFQISAIRAVIRRAKEKGQVWLEQDELSVLLRTMDIKTPASETVAPDRAAEAAGRLGYPLVLKAVGEGIIHKSELGAVVLGLESREEVLREVSSLEERLRRQKIRLERVFLQREIREGAEMIAGISVDPLFGSMVMAGFGGVQVELLKDVAFQLTPVSDVDAFHMVQRLRCVQFLEGYRGSPSLDRQAYELLLMKLSALSELVPELEELDLNPVKVLPEGQGVCVVDARLRLG